MKRTKLFTINFALTILMVLLTQLVGANDKVMSIAVIGDPHLPGNQMAMKKRTIEQINNWKDIDQVVVVGDLCEKTGTEKEYRFAKEFFKGLDKPVTFINGNHDYVYQDFGPGVSKLTLGNPESRKLKLERFRSTFGLKSIYSSKIQNGYHLIFLSLDALDGKFYAEISAEQLKWFEIQLEKHPQIPTVVFCHSPLWSSRVAAMQPGMKNYVTLPIEQLETIVQKHKQLFLWVSGHVHLGSLNPLSYSPLNVFAGQVTTINNCDLNGTSIIKGSAIKLEKHADIWTKILDFYQDRVEVRIFDQKKKVNLKNPKQVIYTPVFSGN